MPKSQTHWGYDVLTVLLVVLVSVLVFWAVPVQAAADVPMAQQSPGPPS
jgi:hypothetical protein